MPTLTMKLKLTPAESRALRAKARAEKQSLTAFARSRLIDTAPIARRQVIVKKHPVSGLLYDAGGEGLPQDTQEQIKAALADFP